MPKPSHERALHVVGQTSRGPTRPITQVRCSCGESSDPSPHLADALAWDREHEGRPALHHETEDEHAQP